MNANRHGRHNGSRRIVSLAPRSSATTMPLRNVTTLLSLVVSITQPALLLLLLGPPPTQLLSSSGTSISRTTVTVDAYVPPEVRKRWVDTYYSMDQAVTAMEECAAKAKNSKQDLEELWWAFKYVDRNANTLYPTLEDRKALMDRCNGSWELRLACNSDKDESFYPHPEFRNLAMAFSTVKEDYFGKGIGTLDKGFCFVALGGPSTRDYQRRQVFMNYEDYFINGRQVPGWDLSYYVRGYERNWYPAERKRPKLAFTVVFATDKAMAVRGSKTGGAAIFRKIPEDMSEVAYGT